MNITNVKIEDQEGYPVLTMEVDGRRAEVVDPKPWLLSQGIVVLLDDEGYWEQTLAIVLPPDPADGRLESTTLPGATSDPEIVDLVRRFIAGEQI